MKQLLYAGLIFLSPSFLRAQIVLNEASNSNGNTVVDSDGSTSDWIELYNTSGTAVNLQGLGLTDDPEIPMKWTFPNYLLAPNGFLVILASGKGSPNTVDHYETAVFASDPWQYIIPSATIPNWNMPGFNAASWTTAPLGIGYGDGDDATTIANPTATVYVRREFTISDRSAIQSAFFDADFDDGFVAYLNGVEIARSTLGGNPPNWDEPAGDHEAAIYQGGAPMGFEIDPGVLESALVNGTNVLAVEVHNLAPNSSDLSLIPFLTFGFTEPGVFYNGTVHNWFTPAGSSAFIQTNFSIKTTGETLYLSDASGVLLDSLAVPDLEADMSFGKQADGVASGYVFTTPTPGASNTISVSYTGHEQIPVIQFSGGFYPAAVAVTVTNQSTTGGVLRYTLDGQTPDMTSAVYSGPITIPASMVLKVRCFSPDASLLPSLVATESYFIMEDFTLPVISITTDDANLYGATGIFDNYTTDWRRPCFIEYFDAAGQKQFESHASIKPDGGAGGSRSNPQHSVTIEPAHGVYGEGEPVHYPLIPEKGFIQDYYAFYLRNGSNYWNQYPQKDATFMRMMRETNVNSQAYTPVVAYVNGEYFGVYELREKASKEYFEVNYGNDPDSVDLLSVSYFYGPGILRTVQGSDTGFYAMHDFVQAYPATAPDYFEQCNRKIDLYNFADYLAGENWFGNQDWVYNNMKIARTRTKGNKWRFFLQDMELGLGGWSDYNVNLFDYFRNNNQPNAYWDIYAALAQNTEFRNYFVNRYADLMNTVLRSGYYTPVVNSMYNELLPEMPRHFARWTGNVTAGMVTYAYIANDLLSQFGNRSAVVRNQMLTEYSLSETVDVTLAVSPPGAGYIKISTIVPETLPWTGVYFDGVPVGITAVPNPGYTFDSWQANTVIPAGSLDSIALNLNIGNDDTFTALFTGTAQPLELTISEVNYNADPSVNGGNWIELHNYGTAPLNIDGWKLKSKHFWEAYVFPMQTVIPANGYLVVCEDTNLFASLHPQVDNFIGPTGFGWSNSRDSIQLYNAFNNLVIQTVYGDSLPFPECADGYGRTMENRYTNSAQLDSSSWYCGCIAGSPGTAFIPCDEAVYFSEINYNSIQSDYAAGDWVELKNTTGSAIQLAGYTFKDAKDGHSFTLPDITIPAGGYWVLTANDVLFANRHNEVMNFTGTFDFGLGKKDALRLYDDQGILVTSVLYSNMAPWPLSPSIDDYTLEYSEQNGYRNPNDAASWFAGCEGGSPGRAFTNCPQLPAGVEVGVYPNPTNGMLNVVFNNENNSSNKTDIELFDLNGNVVRRFKVQEIEAVVKAGIDVSDLSNGVYFLKVIQDGRVAQVQFVKI